jgi:short-subunit dehydrogenase
MKDLTDKVVVITGGSTGLGLALARNLVREGCILAVCARSEEDLELTKLEFLSHGFKIFCSVCDVSQSEEVDAFIEAVLARFGKIDILVNNAGVISVGALESFDLIDYHNAMDIMFWGIVHTSRAVLPHFKARNSGQIINVTSIGGVAAVPQLHPYVAAKFAAVGYSMGMAAELRKDNITVTTIVPGLMRTGSFINALFQQGNRKEFKLFAAMSTAPLITISVDKAVREIVSAIRHKKIFATLGVPAKIIHELYHFFPSTMIRVFGFLNRFVPAKEGTISFERGENIRRLSLHAEAPLLRGIGRVLRKNYQHAGAL